jgi:hypothetical protein
VVVLLLLLYQGVGWFNELNSVAEIVERLVSETRVAINEMADRLRDGR